MTKTAVRFSFDSKGFLVKHIFYAPQLVESCGAFFIHAHSRQDASYPQTTDLRNDLQPAIYGRNVYCKPSTANTQEIRQSIAKYDYI